MNKRDAAFLARSIAEDRVDLARPDEQLEFNGVLLACYPVEKMNAILKRMALWEEAILGLIDEGDVTLED